MTFAIPKKVLLMSSFVSASRVGAAASAFCLRRLGIETVVLPTTLMGRHPGWGPPGGGAVPAERLSRMWDAICQQGITFDAVMTGYMGEAAHAELAADIIKTVKAGNPDAKILIDPVMGDNGRLYISAELAASIKETLIPLADIITPNLWELSHLTDADYDRLRRPSPGNARSVAAAASALPSCAACAVLVTSVPFLGPQNIDQKGNHEKEDDEIGVIFTQNSQPALRVSHKKFGAVPHGGGDALAATFLAHWLRGEPPSACVSKSVGSLFSILTAAAASGAGEMPLISEQDALFNAEPLPVQIIPALAKETSSHE